MRSRCAERITSLESASECISWISGYETEAEVIDASRLIVNYFGMEAFVFGALSRTGEREHHRYLVGCAPEWCYTYTQNKWYAIDPYIDYALQNTAPALVSEVDITSSGQQRMRDTAAEYGYTDGIVVPAHSSSSTWIGLLYLTTGEAHDKVESTYRKYRTLMRAFSLELLEWWDAHLRETYAADLDLDELDLELLIKAQEDATAEEAALEVGIPPGRVKWRYERLMKKLGAHTKRRAVERAMELGLIKPTV